jgi:L-ascorbate metabolism protein UlaG (beta-lactamase superfamily)
VTTIRLTHIGGPTTLIEFDGWRILTDPTFDPPGRRYKFALGTSSRKTTGPAFDAATLGPVDAVLLTHDHHADNLDDAGREVLSSAGVVITTASGARRLGGASRGLEPWATTALEATDRPTIEVTATPCRHGPPGSHPIVGDVIGFALRWEGQRHGALWVSGDTVLFDGVRRVGERLPVGIALIHLDAVQLCESLRPHIVVPVHYEGWSHFSQGRAACERQFATAPADLHRRIRWLTIGSPTELVA